MTTVGTEHNGQADHANRSTCLYLTCSKGTALAACSTPCRLQARYAKMFKSLRGQAPQYLTIRGMPVGVGSQSPTTRSSNTLPCVMPLTKTPLADRSFAMAMCIWNTLTASLRLVDDCMRFKRLLKANFTFVLFSCTVCKFSTFLHILDQLCKLTECLVMKQYNCNLLHKMSKMRYRHVIVSVVVRGLN